MIKQILALLKLRGWFKTARDIKETKGVQAMLAWIKARLVEPSTRAAIATVLGLVGVNVSDGILQAAFAVLTAVALLYEAIRKEYYDEEEGE